MAEIFSSLLGRFSRSSNSASLDSMKKENDSCEQPPVSEESNTNIATSANGTSDELDLAFCVDCTASMGAYIDSAQQNVRTIIQELSTKANIATRFALVEYRDHPPEDSTFITREHNFTDSLDNIQNSVNGMSAEGGGDGPESVCCAYEKLLRLNWRESATKVVVHIADAPPHGIEPSGDGFPNGCPSGNDPLQKAHEMKNRSIVLYTVGCEPALGHYQFARDFMVAVADITGGQATTLTSAHLLPSVILHGSEEEIVLQRLQDQVKKEVVLEQDRCEREGVVFDLEVAKQNVCHNLRSRGVKTKHMRTDQRLHAPNASVFKAKASLRACRDSLPAVPATQVQSRSRSRKKFGRSGRKAPKKVDFRCRERRSSDIMEACNFSADCETSYDLHDEEAVSTGATKVDMETDDISMEQVSRMMTRMY